MQDLARDVTQALSRAVSFDGICILAMDPATLLPTGEVVDNGLPPQALPRLIEIEMGGEDFNAFRALAHARTPVGTLSEATHGELERSVRHRELKRPHGFGDELRAVLVEDAATWGALTLLRGSDREPFTATDAALVASVTGLLAESLRRATLAAALSNEPPDEEQPGLALLAPDNSLSVADDAARRWLAELEADAPGQPLPPVVSAVASRARGIAEGRTGPGQIARARVRTAGGVWLIVRGWTLGDDAARTAVIFERARPHELAPLIADAYELTDRERQVTQLVAQGFATDAIAARLFLSPWTVQDHLKSIFEKTGVSSRGELVARLFFEHYAPRLTDAAANG